MARTPTCPYCNKPVSSSQPSKDYKNRKYHIACYRKMQNEQFNVNYEAEVVKKDEKQELLDYIKSLLKVEELDGLIFKQIEKFTTEYNLTYIDIQNILIYFFEIQGNSTKEARGIGIVPYVMGDAREFYKIKKEAHELLKNKEIKKPDKIEIQVKNKPKVKPNLIDIGDL